MSGRLLVVGDALLDRDLVGTVDRLCPEAPVPVVGALREHPRPGGAALAAYLAARQGAEVTLVAPVGTDPASRCLRTLLETHLTLVALPLDGPMPEKVRVRTEQHALLRLDLGGQGGPADAPAAALDALAQVPADAVLVSDYGLGTAARPEIRSLLARRAEHMPLVWDPHRNGPAPVPGTCVATPNLSEALHAANLTAAPEGDDRKVLLLAGRCASVLAQRWRSAAVAVTLGRLGALLSFGADPPLIVSATPQPESDACGAGDALAAAVALELGGGALPSEAVTAAVDQASTHVAAGGAASLARDQHAARSTVRVQSTTPTGTTAARRATSSRRAEDIVAATRARHGTVVATGGCFDILHAGHIAMLQAARELGDCLIVCLNSDASIGRLKGPGRPVNGCDDRRLLLEELGSVDAVTVFDEDTPEVPLTALRPDIWVKGGDYAVSDLPEARLVASWGGQTLVVPYLPGRSTTRLIELARESGCTEVRR